MHSLKEGEDQKEISIEPAQALDEVEPLPEDCYSRPISLTEGVCARRPLTPVLIIYHPNWDVTEVFTCPPSYDAPPAASPARFPARVGVPAPPQTQTPPDEALAALQGEQPRFSIPPEKSIAAASTSPLRSRPFSHSSPPAEMWAQPEQAGV